MKRTIPLSLLLLIAGNGLMVTQAHAGFLDNFKNKASQYYLDSKTQQKIIGAICLTSGLFDLSPVFKESIALFINKIGSYMWHINATASADNKMDINIPINQVQKDIKLLSTSILKNLVLGIPSTALGGYLLRK